MALFSTGGSNLYSYTDHISPLLFQRFIHVQLLLSYLIRVNFACTDASRIMRLPYSVYARDFVTFANCAFITLEDYKCKEGKLVLYLD